jgi:hypothetical protein
MNERIKALLLNARNMFDNGVTESNNKIYIHGSEENLEKFAELIVKECVAICQDTDGEDNIDARSGRQDCAVEIREHFGVEE